MKAGLIVLVAISALQLCACSPTYPNGVIKNRSAAIEAWRLRCAGEQSDQLKGKATADLRNGKWVVGYHDDSAILMAIFDAKTGNMERCYRGAIN